MEVISAELNGNGTVSTAVDVNRLQSHHRRTKRSSKEITLANFQSRISHKVKYLKDRKLSSYKDTLEAFSFPVTLAE